METKNPTAKPGYPAGDPPIPPGSLIGRYEVIGLLGGGGMGLVYRAFDTRLQREVAIKVLHEKESVPGMRERLIREARAVSAINHPSICTLYDIGEQTGDPYLVMELLQGETLRDRMRRKPLTPAEIVEYSMQISDALTEAHKNNIIHRDIKPANIFLCSRASGSVQVKVLDFGLAKRHTDTLDNDTLNLTNPGTTIGTISYMSPEQARGELLDARTDLFSFGAVMYEMATNSVPFVGQTSAMVFVELLEHDPKPVRELNSTIPMSLAAIINKSLRKELADRYQSAREIHADLERVWANLWEPTAITPAAPPPPVAPQNLQRPATRSSDLPSPSEYAAAPPPASPSGPVEATSPQPLPSFSLHDSKPTPTPPSTPVVPGNRVANPTFEQYSQRNVPAAATPAPPSSPVPSSPTTESVLIKVGPASGERIKSRESSGRIGIPPQAAPTAPSPVIEKKSKKSKKSSNGPLLFFISVVIIALIACGIYFQFVRSSGNSTLVQNDFVAIGRIENKTDSALLDHSFRIGLGIALEQSPFIRTAIAPDNAQGLPGERGALQGTITGSGPYVIDLIVAPPGGGKPLAEVQDAAQSPDDILSTIDRVAREIRRQAGEPQNSIDSYFRPLHQEATASLDAMDAFSVGEEIMDSHGPHAAAEASFLKALDIDKYFTLASERLALLYAQDGNAASAAQYADSAYSGRQILSERSKLEIEVIHAALVEKDNNDAQHWLKELHATFPQDDSVNSLVKK